MSLTIETKTVISSLQAGHQPSRSTPNWILEGMEQAGLIQWGSIEGDYNGWKLATNSGYRVPRGSDR